MYRDFLIKSVKRTSQAKHLDKAVEDAKYQNKLYTGKGQEELITSYRIGESPSQKSQRVRITITHTKHMLRQIENVLNQLDMMDMPAMKFISKNKNIEDEAELERYSYENNMNSFAFETVKFYNIIDANAICTVGVNSLDDIEFRIYESKEIHDSHTVNNIIKWVIVKEERKVAEIKVYDYILYHGSGIEYMIDKRGESQYYNEGIGTVEEIEGYYYFTLETTKNYAFNLGYIKDPINRMRTFLSLIDPASELFKSLVWQGSEIDTDKATHGIIEKYAYAQKCNFSMQKGDDYIQCSNGSIIKNGAPSGEDCPKCKGGGLKIHTSSQDVITYPFPNDGETPLKLSDLTHTVFAPDSFMKFKSDELKDLKDEIMRTIFNATTITKDEIAATATEKVIDLQGIYATLNQLGKQVSEFYIWCMECVAAIKGIQDVDIIHGYTLNLKLESVEDLAEKRAKLIAANAPSEIVKAVDMAILQKQHIDSPQFLNRFSIWEKYRPFSDKSDQTAMQILSGLPPTNKYKVLYQFWGEIKGEIMSKYDDDFFEFDDKKRRAIIDEETNLIIAEIGNSQPQRLEFGA